MSTSPPPASGLLGGGQVRKKVLNRNPSLFTAPYAHCMCHVTTELFGFNCTFLVVPSVSYVFVMVNFIFQLDWVPGYLAKHYFGCLRQGVLEEMKF